MLSLKQQDHKPAEVRRGGEEAGSSLQRYSERRKNLKEKRKNMTEVKLSEKEEAGGGGAVGGGEKGKEKGEKTSGGGAGASLFCCSAFMILLMIKIHKEPQRPSSSCSACLPKVMPSYGT